MSSPHVLVINCGSSSIKLALLEPSSGLRPWSALAERLGTDGARLVLKQQTTELPGADHERALDVALSQLPQVPDSQRIDTVGYVR